MLERRRPGLILDSSTTSSFRVQIAMKTFLPSNIRRTLSSMPEGSGFSACSQLKSRLTSLIASRYFRNFPTTCSSSDVKLCPTKTWIFFISNLPPHPHFEYPNFKQVTKTATEPCREKDCQYV